MPTRSRYESTDPIGFNTQPCLRLPPSDLAACLGRSLMKLILDLITPLFFGIGFPIIMMFVGRAMISNRDGDRSKPCFGIPAAGKSKRNQGAVNVYGGRTIIRWSQVAVSFALVFLMLSILAPISPFMGTWLIQFAVPMSALLILGSIVQTGIWSRDLSRSEQGSDGKPDTVAS